MSTPDQLSARPLSLHQMALTLNLPRDWLQEEALSGRIPCLKAGKRLLFNRQAVERALLKRAATALARTCTAEGDSRAS